ncbi:hypothetical protein KUW17_13440 [Leisingera aquaemixtae]|uniref:hypothetical protein n=1 Tax=Leisingera TaxID=191028 RepID=UPI001C94F228|nr:MULTISPECIES: hypothetical protein [Leisingera]MBY6067755.1 hypothetical protein [Leisingera aquaemixtae]MCB4456712.1 hypothetical protein [Leisingera sp. McT4-56]
MEQCYQPEIGEAVNSRAGEPSDAEILAAVRQVLTAEVVEHPDYAEAPAGRGWLAGKLLARERPASGALAARLLGRFRG